LGRWALGQERVRNGVEKYFTDGRKIFTQLSEADRLPIIYKVES
jgi:hypothetical protein